MIWSVVGRLRTAASAGTIRPGHSQGDCHPCNSPPQLSFDGVARADEFQAYVSDRLAVLAEPPPRMQNCALALRGTVPAGTQRCQYAVSMEARVAGASLHARHDHEDNIMVALAYALLAMRRQLVNVRQGPRRVEPRPRRRMAPPASRPSGQRMQAGA